MDSYWHDFRYYMLTDQPSSMPKLEYIAALSVDSGRPQPPGARAAEIMAMREPAMFPYVNEKEQLGTSISFDEALARFSDAVELPSPMVSTLCVCADGQFICNDDGCEFLPCLHGVWLLIAYSCRSL
jgi:hypothetical protein